MSHNLQVLEGLDVLKDLLNGIAKRELVFLEDGPYAKLMIGTQPGLRVECYEGELYDRSGETTSEGFAIFRHRKS